MKQFFAFAFLFISGSSFAQTLIAFEDFNNYFRTFENGAFKMLEFQRVEQYKAGDEYVAYIDNRGNLRVYDGKERRDLSNMQVNYQVSDHLLAWSIGETLNMWHAGKVQTLTFFGGDFAVRDSMIVYTDIRFNTLNVYYRGNKSVVQTATGILAFPTSIGDNILGFVDNGNVHSIYYRGKSHEIGVWNGAVKIASGCDIAAFNDPITRTFAVFDKGEFYDLQDRWVERYDAGRGIIAYEDINGNLMVYHSGKHEQISNFPSDWKVYDDLVYYRENNMCYVYFRGKTYEISNFVPQDYKMKNGVFAFRNIMGGVSAFIEGEIHEITNLQKSEYEIYGSSVLVRGFNNAIIVFKDGKKYVP